MIQTEMASIRGNYAVNHAAPMAKAKSPVILQVILIGILILALLFGLVFLLLRHFKASRPLA